VGASLTLLASLASLALLAVLAQIRLVEQIRNDGVVVLAFAAACIMARPEVEQSWLIRTSRQRRSFAFAYLKAT